MESRAWIGDDNDVPPSFSLSILTHSAAVGTSWSDPESRLKMSVHLVDFLVLSWGVERAVIIALIRDGVAVTSIAAIEAEGRGVQTEGGLFDLMRLASLATFCDFSMSSCKRCSLLGRAAGGETARILAA